MKINGEWINIRVLYNWGEIHCPSSGRIGFYGVHVEIIEQAETRIVMRIKTDLKMTVEKRG